MKTCKRKKSYPDWAKYKAFDKDGKSFLFENEPIRITIEGLIINPLFFYKGKSLKTNKKSKKHKMVIFRIAD